MAARNKAAFEWIHHEPVARKAGVTTEQLTRVGDLKNAAAFDASGTGQLSPLQSAAAAFADSMTANVQVRDSVFDALRTELTKAESAAGASSSELEGKIHRKMVEAAGTVAVYNMVSRFLVALDIDDRAKQVVPVPGLERGSSSEAAPSYPEEDFGASRGLVQVRDGLTIATRVHFHSMQAPWVILVNSLMTNLSMWDSVVSDLSARYNVVCYDQRGHGGSAVPDQPCTVEQLADDAADVLSALGVDKARAIIGVSQGGATALAFALRHPDRAEKVVANDTQPISPEANFQAWEDRIALAKREGMGAIAKATVSRWYGESGAGNESIKAKASNLISSTKVDGFEQGARALQKYDLVSKGLLEALAKKPTLLIAGEADGALPKVLGGLADDVQKKGGSSQVQFQSISKAAHLPMMDNPREWLDVVLPFLSGAKL